MIHIHKSIRRAIARLSRAELAQLSRRQSAANHNAANKAADRAFERGECPQRAFEEAQK